jgi:hypothetical protein
MRFRSIAALLLAFTALQLPGMAAAQRTADESMQGITAQAHFRIRASEMCGQPDEAERREMASKILGWISAESARVGVSQAALVDAAQQGVRHAETRIGTPPSAEQCEASTRQFQVFLKSMISQRESQQRSVLDMHARTHAQLRVAELCGDPDDTKRKEMAARINDALSAYGAEAGVLSDLLANNAVMGARAGESAYAQNPSADACRKNASSLISLGGG